MQNEVLWIYSDICEKINCSEYLGKIFTTIV